MPYGDPRVVTLAGCGSAGFTGREFLAKTKIKQASDSASSELDLSRKPVFRLFPLREINRAPRSCGLSLLGNIRPPIRSALHTFSLILCLYSSVLFCHTTTRLT